jgi:hypothetical protein
MTVPTFLSVTGSPVTSSGTLAVSLSGTALPETSGGTAQTTYATGDILYASGSNTLAKRTIGSTGQVLTVSGGVPTWATPSGGVSWATYTGSQAAPTVTASTNILALNFGSSTNSIATTGTRYGAMYGGAGITTSGTSDGNIVLWSGVDFSGAATLRTTTLASINNTVFICPSSTGNRVTTSNSVVIGAAAFDSGGGSQNVVIGGNQASVTNGSGNVVIGASSSTSATSSTVIGSNSSASGTGGVSIGSTNTTVATGGISIGQNVNNQSQYSIAIGGSNTFTGGGSRSNTILIGHVAYGDFSGEINICNAGFSAGGDIHTSLFPYYTQTSNATATELACGNGNAFSTAPTNRIALTNNSTYMFNIDLVARKSTAGTDYACWKIRFLINREANAASTALVGTPSGTTVAEFATAGASTWAVSVTADTTNGRPNISVTGQAATTIRWVANIRMTKVSG